MHVLGQMVEAVKPGGLVLDLQVIRPNPIVEVDGPRRLRDRRRAALPQRRRRDRRRRRARRTGRLIEQAVDDHDVRKHYDNGADLVDAFATKRRKLPHDELPALARARAPVRRARALPPAPSPA